MYAMTMVGQLGVASSPSLPAGQVEDARYGVHVPSTVARSGVADRGTDGPDMHVTGHSMLLMNWH